jgi:hypothetical protein
MFAYLNKRPRSSYATRPSTRNLIPQTSTGSALGPGRYSISKSIETPSFEFPRSERFENSDYFAKFFNHKKITTEEKEKIHKRIIKNKETAFLSKEERQQILKQFTDKNKIRSEVAKITRKNVNDLKIKRKVEKSKEKFRKFGYRMRMKVFFI